MTQFSYTNIRKLFSYYFALKVLEYDGASGVQCGYSVTYNPSSVSGASVVLPCSYDYSLGHIYLRGEWYEEKSGRVIERSKSNYPDCSLEMDKLTDEHSGVYHFRFYTSLHLTSWIAGSSGVTLPVTGNNNYIYWEILHDLLCTRLGEGGGCCRESESDKIDLQHLLQVQEWTARKDKWPNPILHIGLNQIFWSSTLLLYCERLWGPPLFSSVWV